MTIPLDEPRAKGLPVVKRTALGQQFNGMLVRQERRNILKNGEPVINERGKPKQELVLTTLALPGTTAPAAIGDTQGVPEVGDLVRLILRGAAYSEWIEQTNALGRPVQVGDVVEQTTTHGQAYTAEGKPDGAKLTTQPQIDAVPRSKTLGIYGPLTVRPATTAEAAYVARAEQAYHELKAAAAQPIALDDAVDVDNF